MSAEQVASMSDIHAFAHKWLDKFKYPQTRKEESLGHHMADDCRALVRETPDLLYEPRDPHETLPQGIFL